MADIKAGQKAASVTTATGIRLVLAALGTLAALTAHAGQSNVFGWNVSPLSLNGGSFIANTMLLSDFGQIMVNSETGAFTEAGYLPVLGFALNGRSIDPSGFDSAAGDGWGAYVQYQGAGVQMITPTGIVATYTSLIYEIYGFNGVATYGLDPFGAAYENGGTHLTLFGKGDLISGSVDLVPTAFLGAIPVQFAASGNIQATITDVPHGLSPDMFLAFDVDLLHPSGELFPISPTTIEADGGSSSTAYLTAVPEPASASLLAAAVVPIGISWRRRVGSLLLLPYSRCAADSRRPG